MVESSKVGPRQSFFSNLFIRWWWQVAITVCVLVLLFQLAAVTIPSALTVTQSSGEGSAVPASPTLTLSSSHNHIHFQVQPGLAVVTQHALDALHVGQERECSGISNFNSEQLQRWEKCAERNESQWTCSACTYPLHEYQPSWGRGVVNSSARIADPLYTNHFTGTVPLHGFVHAVHESYRRHLPLTIAVEDVWILIIQALSQHINYVGNAERLRPHFVSHQGRDVIEVEGYTWEDIFESIGDEISARTVPGRASLFAQPFSSTSPVQSLLMQAAVMEAMRAYFEYRASLICGIPSIRLLGTVDDWLNLQSRLINLRLSQLDTSLSVWETQLTHIVEHMVASRRGTVDVSFWQSFYRMRIRPFSMYAGCAGPADTLNGHLTSFFPYITPDDWPDKYTDTEPNSAILHSSTDADEYDSKTLSLSQIPTGVSRVPFEWMNSPQGVQSMKLYAGFDDASVMYDESMDGGGEVRATYGWALALDTSTAGKNG